MRPTSGRDIGLPKTIHDLRGKSRPIVPDRDLNIVFTPGCRHLDPLTAKVDGILNEIAETVEDRWIASSDRFWLVT